MLIDRPFEVVTPSVDGDVLAVLARADASFTVQQVQALTQGRSYGGVRNAIMRLVDQGIVLRHATGRGSVYALNRDHLLAGAVVEIASAKVTLIERMRASVEAVGEAVVFASLFGSAARGEMSATSDIDVFIVRVTGEDTGEWRRWVGAFTQDVHRWTGNDVRIVEMSHDEAVSGALQGDPVLKSIRSEGIHLGGRRDFLAELLGGR